jgi:hypothetical protein
MFPKIGKGRDLVYGLEERLHRRSCTEYVLRGADGAIAMGNSDIEQIVEGPFCKEGCSNMIARRELEVLLRATDSIAVTSGGESQRGMAPQMPDSQINRLDIAW